MASGEGVHTRALARYIAGNHDADFPSDLVHRMKLLTLDTIGCGLLTTDLPWTVTLRETLQATEAPGPRTLRRGSSRCPGTSPPWTPPPTTWR